MAAPEMKQFQGPAMLDLEFADADFLYQSVSSVNLQDTYEDSAVVKGCSTSAIVPCLILPQWGVRERRLNPMILLCN
jgi:hypothetical protein